MHRSEYKRRSQKITPSQEDFFFLNRHRELPGVVKKPSRVSAVWRSLPPPSGPQPARPAPWRPRALGKVSATARLPPRSSSADPWGLRELAGGVCGGGREWGQEGARGTNAGQLSHSACHYLSAVSHLHRVQLRLASAGGYFP